MPTLPHAGFMGYATVTGQTTYTVRCSDFNINVTQEPKFYNHIIGLRDSIPTSITDSKGDIGAQNPQNIFYRGGVKLSEGSVGFPITDVSGSAFLDEAIHGGFFNLTLNYDCDRKRSFSQCKVDTYSISATAGDIPVVTAGIKAISLTEDSFSTVPPYTVDEKLLTWDDIVVTGLSGNIMSFDVNINNACMPIYTAGTNENTGSPHNLEAKTIRVGTQQVTGTFTFYCPDGLPPLYLESVNSLSHMVTVDFGSIFKINLNILFPYPEISGTPNTLVQTYNFVGTSVAIDLD